jgi:hypothetical protein
MLLLLLLQTRITLSRADKIAGVRFTAALFGVRLTSNLSQ